MNTQSGYLIFLKSMRKELILMIMILMNIE